MAFIMVFYFIFCLFCLCFHVFCLHQSVRPHSFYSFSWARAHIGPTLGFHGNHLVQDFFFWWYSFLILIFMEASSEAVLRWPLVRHRGDSSKAGWGLPQNRLECSGKWTPQIWAPFAQERLMCWSREANRSQAWCMRGFGLRLCLCVRVLLSHCITGLLLLLNECVLHCRFQDRLCRFYF